MLSRNNSITFFRTGNYAGQSVFTVNAAAVQSYKAKVLWLIAVFSVLRIFTACALELGNDEAYYWLYSQKLQWNYFDHPPMIALWIRLFTANLALQSYAGFIRLGSILSAALASWFLFRTCTILHSQKAGWYAACLYNASFYAGITAGIYAMPDAPQMAFWTFSLLMIARITKDERNWTNWLLLGAGAGLCIMSKVHGVFVWGGLLLFATFMHRRWLLMPQFYIALFITAVLASPILFWNINNHFDTYRFHSQRVTVNSFRFNYYSFAKELCGQFFFNNPFNVFVTVCALRAGYKGKFQLSGALRVYVLSALPLSFILILISVFRDTLPHWSGPAYVSLIPVAAVWLAEQPGKWLNALPGVALIGHVVVLGALLLFVNFFPGTFGNKTPDNYGKGDISLDMNGWEPAGLEFQKLYASELEKGHAGPHTPVVTYKWWAAHQDYYFCRPAGIPLIGLGPVNNIHQYLWTNGVRLPMANMDKAYCIVPSDENYDVSYWFRPYYSHFNRAATITLFRNGRPAKYFYVYLLSGWKGRVPLPV